VFKISTFLPLIFCTLVFANCEDEYVDGVGWKKIYYPSDGSPPTEAVGRCQNEEEKLLTLVALGLVGWFVYENFSTELSIYSSSNIDVLPLDSFHISIPSNPELKITLFEFRF